MSQEYCRNFPVCTNIVMVDDNATETPLCVSCEREEGESISGYIALVAEVNAEQKLYAHRLRSKQRNHEGQEGI